MKKSSEKKTALCLSEKRHNEGMTAIHLYTLQPPIPPFHKPFFAHCSIARIHSQLNRTMNRCRAPRALRLHTQQSDCVCKLGSIGEQALFDARSLEPVHARTCTSMRPVGTPDALRRATRIGAWNSRRLP